MKLFYQDRLIRQEAKVYDISVANRGLAKYVGSPDREGGGKERFYPLRPPLVFFGIFVILPVL